MVVCVHGCLVGEMSREMCRRRRKVSRFLYVFLPLATSKSPHHYSNIVDDFYTVILTIRQDCIFPQLSNEFCKAKRMLIVDTVLRF